MSVVQPDSHMPRRQTSLGCGGGLLVACPISFFSLLWVCQYVTKPRWPVWKPAGFSLQTTRPTEAEVLKSPRVEATEEPLSQITEVVWKPDGLSQHTTNHTESEVLKSPGVSHIPEVVATSSTGVTPAGSANLCIDGYLVPELMILGAAKSGTTTLADALKEHRRVFWPLGPDQWSGKFPKYFQNRWNGKMKELNYFNSSRQYSAGKQWWLEHYPPCPSDGRKGVSIDGSVHYLENQDFLVPKRMAETYGPHSSRIKFVVLLREPVSRAWSLFCFYRAKGFDQLQKTTAQKYFGRVFEAGAEGDDYFLNSGNYAAQFAGWFDNFSPSQFTISPWLYYIKPEKMLPTQAASTRAMKNLVETTLLSVGLDIPHSFVLKHWHVDKKNVNSKKEKRKGMKMDLALDPELQVKFRTYVHDEGSVVDVARVLASAAALRGREGGSGSGPTLFAYGGNASNVTAISEWLETGWASSSG
eukprot:TRINITY_DN19022_c0_g1_i1.p1 TRINITY_DN19022_c0_g1~~TRINITY_DN19022_c0_g1_i1.p1  ORF type:complete len:471 (-),score=57.68 TRINITY_DN19022_c0_g1_i1:183-1595(-)